MAASPSHIATRLAAADRSHQKEIGAWFLLRALKFLPVVLLLFFLSDLFFQLNALVRLGLGGALFLSFLGLVGWTVYLGWIRHNQLEHIARLLEDRDPHLGSKLINILQLHRQSQDPALAPLTRQLAGQAVESYSAQLAGLPFERLARTDAVRREAVRLSWAAGGFLALCLAFYQISWVEMLRFMDPMGDHPPYSFTQLKIQNPGERGTNVLYSRGFLVEVKSSGHRPKEVLLSYHPEKQPDQITTVPMFDKGTAGFHQQLEDIRTDTVVYAHTKDKRSLSRKHRIGVILVPQMEKAFIQTTPPAYTGIPPEEKPYAFKGLQALVGTQLRFRLQSNRPLREGVLEFASGDGPPEKRFLSKSGSNEVTGVLDAKDSGRVIFRLVDELGHASQQSWEGALTVTQDLPPEIRLTEPATTAFVAMDFKVGVQVDASDDYGVRRVRLHRALNGHYSEPKIVEFTNVVRNARVTETLILADLGVESGDVISLFAEVLDTSPAGQLTRSETVHLTVISVEEYNTFLRERTDLEDMEEKYASLMNRLQELVEEQKKLGEVAQKLEKEMARADARQKESLQKQLDGLLAQQNELNQKLNQQAKRMEEFVREDPLYDVEAELQESLQQQAQDIRESTQQNQEQSRQIAQASSPPQGARVLNEQMTQDFKKASDDQVKKLGGVQEEFKQDVAQTLQDLSRMQEIMKDFNQFESLYQAQKELAEQSRAYNKAENLSREDQLALKEMAGTEKEISERLAQLEKKLRQDAEAARELFPKAAQSADQLADKLAEARLSQLAQQATGVMLAGQGEQSFQSAERLRGEMEKLFGECQNPGGQPGPQELDQYLQLTRGMNPGNTFQQMSQSRKFAGVGRGRGRQGGQGEGQSGEGGYAVASSDQISVLGNETFAAKSNRSGDRSNRQNAGQGQGAGESTSLAYDKTDALQGVEAINRKSGAVVSESLIDEYSDVVEQYFRALTR